MWAIPDTNGLIIRHFYRSFEITDVTQECTRNFLILATRKTAFGVANSIEMPPVISAL